MANQQFSYGYPGSGAPYSSGEADKPPPYNPSFAATPMPMPQPQPQPNPPLNYDPYYQNPSPGIPYAGLPQQPPPNIVALNSVPTTNAYYGTNYGPGWNRYSSATRKKIFLVFGICAGVMMAAFIIVFVTMSVKAQQEHDAFHDKYFGH